MSMDYQSKLKPIGAASGYAAKLKPIGAPDTPPVLPPKSGALGQIGEAFTGGITSLQEHAKSLYAGPNIRPQDVKDAYTGGGLGAGIAEATAQVAKGATHAVADVGHMVGGAFQVATSPLAPVFNLGTPIGNALGNAIPSGTTMKFEDTLRKNPAIEQNATDIMGLSNLALPKVVEKGTSVVRPATNAVAEHIPSPVDAMRGYVSTKVKAGIQADVDSLLKSTRSVAGRNATAARTGTDLKPILSDPQIFRGIKVENGKINPDTAIQTIDARIDPLLDAKRDILPKVDQLVPPTPKSVIIQRATDYLNKGVQSLKNKQDSITRMENQMSAYPENLKPSEIDALRAQMRGSGRDAKGQLKPNNEYAALENAARDTVFEITDDLPVPNAHEYKALNDYVKQMITTKDFLDQTLRNQITKGGRMKGYSLKLLGTITGSSMGPLGSLVGHAGGGLIADIIVNNQLGSSFKMSLIRTLTDDPAILSKAEQLVNDIHNVNPLDRPALPQGATVTPPPTDTSGIIRGQSPQPQFNPRIALPEGKQGTINGPTIPLGQGFTMEKGVPKPD